MKKVCEYCNEPFGVTVKSGAKYCSIDCRNKGYAKARGNPLSAEDKQAAKEYRNSLKVSCSICGYDRCKQVLGFHHIEGKGSNVSALNTITAINAEIENHPCVVLCANCHTEVHAGVLVLS